MTKRVSNSSAFGTSSLGKESCGVVGTNVLIILYLSPNKVQLNLKQHGFELCRSIYTRISFSKYIRKFFENLQQFERTFYFP